MKINQEESIKLYLRIKTPKIADKPYYDLDLNKNIFSLHNEKNKKLVDTFEINFDKIFIDDNKNSFIYKQTCSNVIKECLNGMSFCFISHGETVSEKLITLIGDTTDENNEDKYNGLFPRILLELYNYINKNKNLVFNSDIQLNYSFICVNGNKIIDLNNFIEKDITNFRGTNYLKEGKSIQNDKKLINYVKKLPVNNYKNTLSFIFNNISLFIKLENTYNDNFYSTSHVVIILYITNNKGEDIATLTFILLNGSEKLNLVENNINMLKNIDFNELDPELKKKSIYASKIAINTQNTYNSIIYLIKQNKKINMNLNFNKEEEEKKINKNESKYISNLTAVLYNICFDWKIKNIKYFIFGNIYPNIGYYKSIKDSILFLYEFYKIIHKKREILDQNKNHSDTEDYEILNSSLFELDNKVIFQNKTIEALNDLLNKKNQKIFNIQNEYDFQVNQLKKSLGFVGDINILLSGNEFTPEAQRAKKIRESSSKIKFLNNKIIELEKKLKKSNEELNIFKLKKQISNTDEIMLKYIDSVSEIKDNKEKERKNNSIIFRKINQLEKELKDKNIIINKLQNDLNNKNNIIHNFSNLIYINNFFDDKNDEIKENKKENEKEDLKKVKNKKNEYFKFMKNQSVSNIEKLKSVYENKLKEEKDFWNKAVDEKDIKLEELKKKYNSVNEMNINLKKLIENKESEISQLNNIKNDNLLEIKQYQNEFLKLNEMIMNIIHIFHLYFLSKSKSKLSLISIKNNLEEFTKIILETEKEINFLSFPILHKLLESKNKLSIIYKTINNKTNKQSLHNSKSHTKIIKGMNKSPQSFFDSNTHTNFSNLLDNYLKNKKININNDILKSKEEMEKMNKLEIIKHCLKLNERIKEIEKIIQKYEDINLENEENKKQIIYLKFKLKNLNNALEEQIKINTKNKIVITSQNRTIEKYNNINKEEKETLSLSPSKNRKSLHFNKSQLDLKTNNDIIFNNLYDKEFLSNYKIYDFFNKYNNKNRKNKIIKDIQSPFNYYNIDSDNQINNRNFINKNSLNIKTSSQKTTNTKFNSYKKDIDSYSNYFHSEN